MVTSALLSLLLAQTIPGFSDDPELKVVSVRTEKESVKVGETFTVVFELEIPEGWYIYPATVATTGAPTTILSDTAEVAGKIDEPKPKTKKDEVIGEYAYHTGTLTLGVPMRLKPGPEPGLFTVEGRVRYQLCSDVCLNQEVSYTFDVTVLEGVVEVASEPDEEYAKRGFVGLILLGMLGGLISLVMPCTYPLIPITLTYFIKQAAGSRTHGMFLSSVYSSGIILAFTGLGFLLTLLMGAGGAREFAANTWVNIGVGALFLWFAGSLFGWYEIRLPFGLGGKLAGSGQRQGAGGAFILGLLFAVVTFTCTIPIAATILTIASGQHRWAALVAMLAYSCTMALPFFVMGIFPGMIKEVPKSGGWLNTVKISMGFVEVGLALFYLSKADLTQGIGILNRPVMLIVWVLVCAVTALYLLNFFRARPGIARALFALVFLAFGGFMSIGFAGKPLGILEIIVPPKSLHGTTLPKALAEAEKLGKPLFIEFTGVT